MLANGAFAVLPESEADTGQGWQQPYAPVAVATGPNWVEPFEFAPAPRSGGYAAIPAAVPLNAYAPRTVAPFTSSPNQAPPNATPMPCNCNGNGSNLSAIPWWGWALIAIGVVAIFRRVT